MAEQKSCENSARLSTAPEQDSTQLSKRLLQKVNQDACWKEASSSAHETRSRLSPQSNCREVRWWPWRGPLVKHRHSQSSDLQQMSGSERSYCFRIELSREPGNTEQ